MYALPALPIIFLKSEMLNLNSLPCLVNDPKIKFLIGKFTPSDNVVVHAKISISPLRYAFSISFLTSIGRSQ